MHLFMVTQNSAVYNLLKKWSSFQLHFGFDLSYITVSSHTTCFVVFSSFSFSVPSLSSLCFPKLTYFQTGQFPLLYKRHLHSMSRVVDADAQCLFTQEGHLWWCVIVSAVALSLSESFFFGKLFSLWPLKTSPITFVILIGINFSCLSLYTRTLAFVYFESYHNKTIHCLLPHRQLNMLCLGLRMLSIWFELKRCSLITKRATSSSASNRVTMASFALLAQVKTMRSCCPHTPKSTMFYTQTKKLRLLSKFVQTANCANFSALPNRLTVYLLL